jgi:tetratricopeptide (TPR) repeat protein
MSTKLLIAAAVLVTAGFAALFGGVLAKPSAAPPDALAAAQSVEDFKAGFALNASTASLVESLQATLRANPTDEHSWVLLGLAYQQRARETGDPAYYTKSGAVLDRALRLDRSDPLVFSGLGSLALSRHRFATALRLGREAKALAPESARTYGVIGDAEIELGRYRLAFRDFDTMDRLRPDLSSYARVSYGRELLGHTAAAIRAMKLAIDAATDTAEPLAWTHVQLGKLYFNHGRYRIAERELELANEVFPSYAYGLDALALDEAALGRTGRAVALERQAVDLIPLPQYVAALGDLYATTGRPAFARRQYATIGVIERLLRANGVRVDLEIAQFDVDHGLRLRHALALARIGHRARPSIDGDDVLAWALTRNGQCRAALGYSQQALHLGTQDATKFFHRGMIERCRGQAGAARIWFRRALALNPHFSILWAPVARKLAADGPNRTARAGE